MRKAYSEARVRRVQLGVQKSFTRRPSLADAADLNASRIPLGHDWGKSGQGNDNQAFSMYSVSWHYFSQPFQIEEKLKSRHENDQSCKDQCKKLRKKLSKHFPNTPKSIQNP